MQPNPAHGRIAEQCHMCRSDRLVPVLDLGHHPHSDSFLTSKQLSEPETFYPLRLVTCVDCGLLQIDYFVNPSVLYQQDYLYMTSVTAAGKKHYLDMAHDICQKFSIPSDSLAIDIGSNVGVLLEGFKEMGLRVLGVDPAPNIAAIANENGIETIAEFFTSAVAKQIKQTYGHARVITGTNVFAHLHEIDDAVEGMRELLAPDGVIVIEAPHAIPFIEGVEYDTIYHQHIGYLSVAPMQRYFKRMGLELFDVEEISIHGGTLRYYVGLPGKHPISPAVGRKLQQEEECGIYDSTTLKTFAEKVQKQRQDLLTLLLDLKKQGKKIVALSAPAKGNTLLNYCGIDTKFIDFATERNPLKIGRYTPGTHIPILADEKLLEEPVDYALLLAWNFANEIMKNNQAFAERGGKFIIPIPTPRIV